MLPTLYRPPWRGGQADCRWDAGSYTEWKWTGPNGEFCRDVSCQPLYRSDSQLDPQTDPPEIPARALGMLIRSL